MTDAGRPMENKEPMFNVVVISGPDPDPGANDPRCPCDPGDPR